MLNRWAAVLVLGWSGFAPASAVAQFLPGGREIASLDIGGTPLGQVPKGIRLIQGSLAGVDKDGVRMLKAAVPAEFVFDLPEKLPESFTLEFDLIPKSCCNPEDLSFEGTPAMSRSSSSAKIQWHPQHIRVIGGGPDYQAQMPADLRDVLPGTLAHIAASFEGETLKLYTNGRRLATLIERRFVRGGAVLRVFLGGQVGEDQAVYLARLRVATGPPVIAQQPSAPPAPAPAPASVVLMPAAPTTGTITPVAPPSVPTPPVRTSEVTRTGETTSLAPPTSLSVNGTPAMARLAWGPPTGWTPTGYTVGRRIVGSTESVPLTSAPVLTTSFEDRSGFTAGKSYTYVVTALSSDLKAFGTAETEFTPPPPQNVLNLKATAAGRDVTISWTGVTGASRYLIAGASEAMAREVDATQFEAKYTGLAPGTYTWTVGARYEPGPVETPAATWPSVTLVLLAPRSIVLSGLNTAGQSATTGPRTIMLPAFNGAGGSLTSMARRTITLGGFTATGSAASAAPPTITVAGFIGVGGFASLAPRTIILPGLTTVGGFTPPASRTITLSGWIAAGLSPVP